MSNLRQAAQQAFEVLLEYQPNPCLIPDTQEETDRAAAFWDAIDDLRAALAEPEQEPVAWLWPHQLEELQHIHQLGIRAWSGKRYKPDGLVAVYTAPIPRKPLTNEEIERACVPLGAAMLSFTEVARAIERAHGIGEQR